MNGSRKCDVHTIEYYLADIKEEILPSVTKWMNVEVIMLSETNRTQKEKYCVISLRCGI